MKAKYNLLDSLLAIRYRFGFEIRVGAREAKGDGL